MKTLKLTIIMLLVCTWVASAQEEYREFRPKKMKTLAGKNSRAAGFGSLELKATEIKNDLTLLPGFTGGVIIADHFVVGLGGYGIATEVDFLGLDPTSRQYLYGGYGGLVLGGIIAPREIFHIYIPVLIGAGGAYISEHGFRDFDTRNDDFEESSAYFVVEPGIELEVNVTKFFRIGIGGSYRYIMESDLANITDKELSNYSGSFSLKFGNF